MDEFIGEIPIGETGEQKYLGFILSGKGDNMANINAIKKKSIGVIRTIMSKLESLQLRQYYFECAMLFMNVILRGSILYASETYYNLTEMQLRRIERIEEEYLRKVLKTTMGCPIVQMYLEVGQWPARFEIQKLRLFFFKLILEEDDKSMVSQFFHLQLQQPTSGDWATTVQNDLKELNILETFDDIKRMSRNKFKNLVKIRMKRNAFSYLIKKRGSKGCQIEYSALEMSEYLLPYNDKMKIEEKHRLFALKNRMVDIPDNFGKKEVCHCGENEDMSHIYSCKYLNEEENVLQYQKLYTGKLSEQIEIFRIFELNMNRRNELKIEREQKNQKERDTIFPCDQINDPLYFVKSSIG